MLLLWTMHLNTLKTGTNAFTMDNAFKHVEDMDECFYYGLCI